MAKVEWIKGSLSEGELLEQLLPQTLSQDQAKACAARLLRETLPGLGRWMLAEQDRGTDPSFIIAAVCDLAGSSMASVAANLAGSLGPRAAVIAMLMAEKFHTGYARTVKELNQS
jgi:hypothetical protein